MSDEYTENKAASRAMLVAALEAIRGMPLDQDRSAAEEMKGLLRAVAAARAVEKNLGSKEYTADVLHVVATALWADFCFADIDEIDPSSVAGERILAFAAVCVALNALSEVESIMDDGSRLFGSHLAKRALALMEEPETVYTPDPGP